MKLTRLLSTGFLLAGLAIVAGGCSGERAVRATTLESSAAPGINDEYFRSQSDVADWVERFEKSGREVYDQRERILREAQIEPGSVVADIGAGTGLFTELLARRVGSNGNVYAVEIVPEFLLHIRQRLAAARLTNVQLVLSSDRSVGLASNSIDTAFLCDVYHHLEYPRSTLASIRAALRDTGQLVVVEFKRVPGVSSAWVLNHVRAGEETFAAEIESAGFEQVARFALKENYLLRFRKRTP